MKKLLLCVVTLLLVGLSLSSPLSASFQCPASCFEAVQRCMTLCGEGCPIEPRGCSQNSSGCYYLHECICRRDLC